MKKTYAIVNKNGEVIQKSTCLWTLEESLQFCSSDCKILVLKPRI